MDSAIVLSERSVRVLLAHFEYLAGRGQLTLGLVDVQREIKDAISGDEVPGPAPRNDGREGVEL